MQFDRKNYYYLRLSKEDGDVETGNAEESCSISSQRSCIQQYIKEMLPNEGDFEEVSDDGFSGTNMHRPGIQYLLKLVIAGKARTIIVRDLSRFARNYLEAGHYLEYVFPAYDVRFISINDRFDSAKLGETTGGLDLAIRNLINQMYSKDISRKIKSTVDMKKLSGEYVYGTAPYGYKKGEKKNTIVVDDTASLVVKKIFTWASEGATVTQIANRLNEEKIITPSVYLASTRGRYQTRAVWTYESVRNILSNRIYTGDTVPFKSHVVRVGSDRVKQVPEELQQVIPDTHEAIISREMYYQARSVIKSSRKSKPAASGNPFTSLLICECCGNRLTKGKAANKSWLCTTARYTKELGCADIRANENQLTAVILRAIIVQCKLLNQRIGKIRKYEDEAKSREQILQRESVVLQRDLEKMQTLRMSLYEEYVEGAITKEAYVTKKQAAADREEEIQDRLLLCMRRLSSLRSQLAKSADQISNAQGITQYSDITELTPELTKALIRKIIVRRDGGIHIEWNFSDEIGQMAEII